MIKNNKTTFLEIKIKSLYKIKELFIDKYIKDNIKDNVWMDDFYVAYKDIDKI